jgi:hypothetical protein
VEKLETSYRIDGSKRRIRFDPREKDAIPDLHYSYFSGNYEAEFDSLKINNRPVYYERGEKDDSTSGMFYYCDAEKSWVFTIKVFAQSENIKEGDDTVVPKETIDRCKDGGWLMRSPITEAFLLDQVPTDSWSIWTGTLNVASDFSITCAECDSDIDCGLRNGKCNSGTCTCEEGRYRGNFCNVVEPCDKLQYFPGGERELSAGSLPPTTEEEPFLVKKEVTAYDRYVCERQQLGKYTTSNQQLTLFLVYRPRRSLLSLEISDLFTPPLSIRKAWQLYFIPEGAGILQLSQTKR